MCVLMHDGMTACNVFHQQGRRGGGEGDQAHQLDQNHIRKGRPGHTHHRCAEKDKVDRQAARAKVCLVSDANPNKDQPNRLWQTIVHRVRTRGGAHEKGMVNRRCRQSLTIERKCATARSTTCCPRYLEHHQDGEEEPYQPLVAFPGEFVGLFQRQRRKVHQYPTPTVWKESLWVLKELVACASRLHPTWQRSRQVRDGKSSTQGRKRVEKKIGKHTEKSGKNK